MILSATRDKDATIPQWFSACFNRQGCYDTLFPSYDWKEASTPCRRVACPSTTLPPYYDFLISLGTFVNYPLWTLSNLLTETLNSLHIHTINTLYLFPINASLHSCAPSFWIVTVYLQTQLFIILPIQQSCHFIDNFQQKHHFVLPTTHNSFL